MEKYSRYELDEFNKSGLIDIVIESEQKQEDLEGACQDTLNVQQKKITKLSNVIKNLRNYIPEAENISDEEKEFIMANLETVENLL